MNKITVFSTAALAAAFALGTVAFETAAAKPGWKGGGGGPPGFTSGHGAKAGWRGASQPPGWSKGKKRGWDRHGHPTRVPPGWR